MRAGGISNKWGGGRVQKDPFRRGTKDHAPLYLKKRFEA